MVASPQPMDEQARLMAAERALRNLINRTDIGAAGLAVPMYARFVPPVNATPGNGTGFDYATIPTASGIAQGKILWEGIAPYISHPYLSVAGTWGQASGSFTAITYTLNANGVTIGTFPQTTFGYTVFKVNVASLLRQAAVDLTLLVTWAGSGSIAAGLIGCYLTPT